MTQEFGADTTGNLIRQILGSFDEYQSRENAKHTLRAMQENARQGFWNGAQPPFGYRTVEAGRRGHKVKKVLALEQAEAAVVRRIFDLALGRAGLPLGVKAIVNRLNAEGCRHRGKPFHISSVHRILTAATYTGLHRALGPGQGRRGVDRHPGAADHPARGFRAGADEPAGAQPEAGRPPPGRQPDPADRHCPLRHLRLGDDAPHRQERALPLLRLRRLRSEGQDALPRAEHRHDQA
jgi:hypothetical protein